MNDMDTTAEMIDRLRKLEDLEEIRRLYIAYGRHLDQGDADAYADLFAREGKLRLGPVMKADGRDAIREAAAATISRSPESSTRSVHLLASPEIEIHGDTGSGECVWAAVSCNEDGNPRVLVGRHVDDLVREEGHWKFARRRGFVDIGTVG